MLKDWRHVLWIAAGLLVFAGGFGVVIFVMLHGPFPY